MKVSISVGSAYFDGANWDDLVDYICAADRLGVAGVDAVRLGPIGRTRTEQRTHLEMAIDPVRRATAPAE